MVESQAVRPELVEGKIGGRTSFNYNPDVLSCLANLSNDEVFTPPELVNQMLDCLPAKLWKNKAAKFLDPVTKSGVFLREIAKRLNTGLAEQIPDQQTRLNHIFKEQLFGIAITELTSLLARRSVYCSKTANGKYAICDEFSDVKGNIWFARTEHTWGASKCDFCGAPKAIWGREIELESYAYAFIHTDNIKSRLAEIFGGNMQFDVIIGNPPYQLKGGAGGSSDSSIYHLFVEQAKKLNPKFLSMVVPSRWLAGGRGLDEFRKGMLNSHKLSRLVDFPISKELFPTVEVKGGVCYFLWSKDYDGSCDVTLVRGDKKSTSSRQIDEFDVFVRDPKSVGILRKVLEAGEQPITDILTADTPFGIATNFKGFHSEKQAGDVALHYVRNGKRAIGFVPRDTITKNAHLIDKWKVLAPKAGSDGGQKIPDSVLGKPWLSYSPSVATQTFLAFWVASEAEANSVESYYRTKFFRHLVSLRKLTQDALRPMYSWVPVQTWDRQWTDEKLYKKYGLTEEEIAFIESMIRPMELADE